MRILRVARSLVLQLLTCRLYVYAAIGGTEQWERGLHSVLVFYGWRPYTTVQCLLKVHVNLYFITAMNLKGMYIKSQAAETYVYGLI